MLSCISKLNYCILAGRKTKKEENMQRESKKTIPCSFLPRCMKCRRDLAMRILSVCLSVRLSVTRVIPDKMEERSVHIFIPYERTFILDF